MGSDSFPGWSFGWPLLVAWMVIAGCIAIGWRRLSSLTRLEAPSSERLLYQLVGPRGAGTPPLDEVRRAAVAELNQRLSDVAFELDLLPATFTALTRISLASGSALALVAFMQSGECAPVERTWRVGLCAVSGLVGASVVTMIGRSAKRRVIAVRTAWDRTSREVGKSLAAD